VRADGDQARVPERIAEVLEGRLKDQDLDARSVQPYYSKRLAGAAGLKLSIALDGNAVVVKAA
jgi:histidine phosphotransferase ChpT